MKKIFTLLIGAILTFTFSTGCSSSSSDTDENDPYYIMHVAFEGSPEQDAVKRLVEGIEQKYSLPNDRETALKIGNVAVGLRKKSVVGFTEMDLLKHVYQHGSRAISFPEQAAYSSVILDKTK